MIENARETGFACADRSFEKEIHGIAAPIFDHSGHIAGAVAVASVASRHTAELENTIKSELIVAAREITRNWGGSVPAQIEDAWAKSGTHSHTLESTQ